MINICMISDNNYSIPTAVALTSLKCNKDIGSKYCIYILYCNLNSFDKEKLISLSEDDFIVNLIEINVDKFVQIQSKTHVPPTALAKFDIPNILNSLDKVLYLDGDIIIQKDVAEIYNRKIDEYYALATRDICAELTNKFHKCVGVEKYFNSGVMLLNLKKIREDNLLPKFIEVKLQNPQWQCMDQDVFNFVFNKKVLFADSGFNLMLPLFRADRLGLDEINDFFNSHYETFSQMQEDAFIVHFAGVGNWRPWMVINGSMEDIWMHYYFKSPYKNISLNRGLYIPELEEILKKPPEAEMKTKRIFRIFHKIFRKIFNY